MKMTLADWPVMIVSGEFSAGNNEGHRLRELMQELKKVNECTVITAATYEDALEIFTSRADIGCAVIDWDLEFEENSEKMPPEMLLEQVPEGQREALLGVLAQDPRPAYQHDENRVYGFAYADMDVRFTARAGTLTVVEVRKE